jgi:hypothetical protein
MRILLIAQLGGCTTTCVWQSNRSTGCQKTGIAEIPLKMHVGFYVLDECDMFTPA